MPRASTSEKALLPKPLIIPMTEVPSLRTVNLIGMNSGRLTVLSISHKKVFRSRAQVFYWNAICSCGNLVTINGHHFLNGGTQSCGCLAQERTSARFRMNPINKKHYDLPPSVKYTPREAYLKGIKVPPFLDKQVGHLKVLDFVGVEIFTYYGSNRRITLRKQFSFLCRCSCGCEVVRTGHYLKTRGDRAVCQKCRKPDARNKNHTMQDILKAQDAC